MKLEYDKDNLERVPFEFYMGEYQKQDPKEIAERCKLPYNEETKQFSVRFLMRPYLVSFPEFEVTALVNDEGGNKVLPLRDTADAKILLLHYMVSGRLTEATPEHYITYRDLPSGELYFRQFQGRCIMRLTHGFGTKPDKFCAGLEAMGAKPVKMGDHGYKFDILDQLSVVFILWEGDEEFQPSVQILFSDNIADAFTAEDLAHVGDISIGAMKGFTMKLSEPSPIGRG